MERGFPRPYRLSLHLLGLYHNLVRITSSRVISTAPSSQRYEEKPDEYNNSSVHYSINSMVSPCREKARLTPSIRFSPGATRLLVLHSCRQRPVPVRTHWITTQGRRTVGGGGRQPWPPHPRPVCTHPAFKIKVGHALDRFWTNQREKLAVHRVAQLSQWR